MNRRSAFSLVELLVAIAIITIIGAAIPTFLIKTAQLWQNGIDSTRTLLPEAQLREQLEVDFTAALNATGFTGTATRCQFWIAAASPPEPASRLLRVEYQLMEKSVLRRVQAAGSGIHTEQRYQPLPTLTLSYASSDQTPPLWTTQWRSHTNAPALLRVNAAPSPRTPTPDPLGWIYSRENSL